MSKTDLCVHILKEYHGELVAKVGACLIRNGCATLRQLASAVGVSQAKVQKALLILIQHGMVEFFQNKHDTIDYKIDVDRVIHRLQFPKVVQCAGRLYGDAAEMLVEELLLQGRAQMNVLVTMVTGQVNEALKAQGGEEVQPSFVRDKFERLVITHFIKRCNIPIKDNKGKVVSIQPPPEQMMYVVPVKEVEGGAVRVKQEPGSRSTGEPPTKKLKVEGDHTTMDGTEDTAVYWEVNHQRFLQHFRDQTLVAAVASRLDNEKAAEVLRTILRHCEKSTDPTALVTQPMTFYDIQSQLPRDHGMTKQTLEQWLKILTENMPEFVSKTADNSGGTYVINVFQALQALCTAHVESVVEERFGSKSLRIFRVILQKKQVEQHTIEKCVLMPAKEVKELLYKMFQEHFVQVTELAKTPDHAPSRTSYLFKVDVKTVARMLLDRSYKAVKNVIIKRRLVLSENKRLLDKQERVNAIIASLKQEGEAAEVDEERTQELQAILEMITPHEKEQLEKVKKFSDHLEASELQLDSTIFVLNSFLALTYHPKPVKPPKDLGF